MGEIVVWASVSLVIRDCCVGKWKLGDDKRLLCR